MAIDINIPSQVKNYANLAGFPVTGSLKTIYIAEDKNKTYRWTGSAYVEISASQATAWGTITGTLSSQTDLNTALNAKVTGNTAITGATKTKITYDSKGLVTAGADATTADIADSLNKRYVTDANLTVIGNTSGTNTGDQTLSGLGGVPTSRTLTINGTTQDLSADRTFTISTGITIGTTAITSGTNGRFLFDDGGVVSETNGAFWDKVNGWIGLGITTPLAKIHVKRANSSVLIDELSANSTAGAVFFTTTKTINTFAIAGEPTNTYVNAPTAGGYINFNQALVERMRLAGTTGNVLINTTTDAGYKLDVNGTMRVQGAVTQSSNQQFDFGNAIRFDKDGATTRIFGTNANINYQVNSTTLQHRFTSQIGAALTGVLMQIDTGGGFVSNPATFLRVLNQTVEVLNLKTNGNLLLGTANDVASSKFTIESTTQGFLPPRMTTAQKNAIASPVAGLQVFDTTLNLMSYYNGTIWI
jgi:hypothetical protein